MTKHGRYGKIPPGLIELPELPTARLARQLERITSVPNFDHLQVGRDFRNALMSIQQSQVNFQRLTVSSQWAELSNLLRSPIPALQQPQLLSITHGIDQQLKDLVLSVRAAIKPPTDALVELSASLHYS